MNITITLLGIVIAVILFMINYLSMRLNRIEEDLPKKIKKWSLKMSGKAINEIVCWMREKLKENNLDGVQKEAFISSLREYQKAIRDVTIIKVFLLLVLIVIFLGVFFYFK